MSDASLGNSGRQRLEEKILEERMHVISSSENDAAGQTGEASHSITGIENNFAGRHDHEFQVPGSSNDQIEFTELSLPFKCDQCTRSFYWAGDLQWHRYKHASGLIYTCDECEGMFQKNNDLEEHMSMGCAKTRGERQPEKVYTPFDMQRYKPPVPNHEAKSHVSLGLKTTSAEGDAPNFYATRRTSSELEGKLPQTEKFSDENHRVFSSGSSQIIVESAIGNGAESAAINETFPVQTSRPKQNDLAREAFETFEEMNSRHRREHDELQQRIKQKKYLATDETRQDIDRKYDDLERRLERRQYMETPLLVDQDTRKRRASKQMKATESKDHTAAISNIDSRLQWMETEKALLQTLEAKERELGPDNISTIDSMKNTARVYFDQGKLVEAEIMYLRALRGYQNVSGPTQVLINGVINNLGRIYYRQGNMMKAEEMYVKALASFESYLGSNHPTTRNTANRLGHVYQQQGKLQEAQRLFGQSTVPELNLSLDVIKGDAPGLDNLQLDSKPRDNLTGTRKFTSDHIRDLGKAFRNNDLSQNAHSRNESDNIRWTTPEDALLLRTIARVGLEDWSAIAALVSTKTPEQCHYRYLRFEKSFGIDPTSSDKYLQIRFLINGVEKGSSSELAHWLRTHKRLSEDSDDDLSSWKKSDAKLEDQRNEMSFVSGSTSQNAGKSTSDDKIVHRRFTGGKDTLGADKSSNSDQSRRRSSQLSAEFGHDGYGYTNPISEKSILEIAGLKAERRAEIERRCMELNPPLTKDMLASMPAYRVTIQDIRPLTDLGWESLKLNLLAERARVDSEIQSNMSTSSRPKVSQYKPVERPVPTFDDRHSDNQYSIVGSTANTTTNDPPSISGWDNKSADGNNPPALSKTPFKSGYTPETNGRLVGFQNQGSAYETNIAKRLRRSQNYQEWSVTHNLDAKTRGYDHLSEGRIQSEMSTETFDHGNLDGRWSIPGELQETLPKGIRTEKAIATLGRLAVELDKDLALGHQERAHMNIHQLSNHIEPIEMIEQTDTIPDMNPNLAESQQKGPESVISDGENKIHDQFSNVKDELNFVKTIGGGRLSDLRFAISPADKSFSRKQSKSSDLESSSTKSLNSGTTERWADAPEVPFKDLEIDPDIVINVHGDKNDNAMHGKAIALFDFRPENDNELIMVEGQVIDILYRHGEGWLVAKDPEAQKSGLVPERNICMLDRLVQGIVDSHDIEEKLKESAIYLANSLSKKSQWFDQMVGDELEDAITALGNEVRSRLHGQGWPRKTLEMHREDHMKAFRNLLAQNRQKLTFGSSNSAPSLSIKDGINAGFVSGLPLDEVDVPDDQSDNSLEFSATESVVSVADSIFSAISLASGSSMSSLSVSQTATDRLVRLLLDDMVIKPLCEDALRENIMSRERFERNLSRLLKGFAVELRKEAQTQEERQAAHLVRFRARNSAHMICSTLRPERAQKSANTDVNDATLPNVGAEAIERDMDMDMDEDSDSASESSEDTPDDFQHLENFVRDSRAFESFREKLRIFIHPQKIQPPSRRNSSSVKQNTLTTKSPGTCEDAYKEVSMLSRGAEETTEALIELTKVSQPPPIMTFEIIRRMYHPITQNLALLANSITIWKRPPVADEKKRIEWRCKCGHRIYDDFTELRPGAANRLKQALKSYESGSTNTSRSSAISSCSKSFSSTFSSVFNLWNSNSSQRGLESELPTHEPPKNQLEPNNPKAAESTPLPVEFLYLLLCYPSGRYATRLLQLDLHNLEPKSDQSLFTILRSNYKSMRGHFFNSISLKTLKSIKFVHFEMYRSSLIDVRQKDVIPPPGHIEYRYSPAPPEVIPPIGDNHLMHLFLNPSHADEDTVCLDRIPKKLKEKLYCKKGQPTNFGWGLEFVEGWDMKSIWIIAFIIFGLGSLILGILWVVYKHSIQDAFAIAGYMVSFAAISVGAMQSLLVM